MRTRKPRSANVRSVSQKISSARRDIKSMLRTLDTLDLEQRELKKVVPSKFQYVPFEGGAESYLKDVEGTTPKQAQFIFGKAVGLKQFWAQTYREFLKVVPEKDAGYAEVASVVLMVIVYNVLTSSASNTFNSDALFKNAIKEIVKEYKESFNKNQDITKAIDAIWALNLDIDSGTTDTFGNATGITSVADSIYPFNGSYIRYLTSILTEDVIKHVKKADFVFKNRNDLYELIASGRYNEEVPSPNLISGITSASALKTWFDKHPEYSLDETYELLARSVDTSALSVIAPSEFNAISRAIKLALDDMESGIIKSGLGTSENLAEMSEFKSRILENVVAKPSMDNIQDIQALLKASTTHIADKTSIESLSAHIFKDVSITEVMNDVATSSAYASNLRPEFFELFDACYRLRTLLVNDYINSVVSPSAKADLEDWLKTNFRGGETLVEKGASSEFEKLANDTLSSALRQVLSIGFTHSDISRASKQVLNALNGLLEGYTDKDAFGIDEESDDIVINSPPVPKFKKDVIEDLLNGGSIDIYDSSANDLSESLYETNEALEDISNLGLERAKENELYGKILKAGNLLQSMIDSILPSALRDPKMRLRDNPALSTMHKVGIGVASYVGTNIGTSLLHRYLPAKVSPHIAEYSLPLVVGGVGGYLAYNGNKDVGIPLLVGAGSSAVMRLMTKNVDHNGAFYKYFLKYAGGAYTAEKIGDNFFALTTTTTESAFVQSDPSNQQNMSVDPNQQNMSVESDQPNMSVAQGQTKGFGRYLSTPVHEPYYVYQPPKRIPASQRIDQYEDIAQTGKVYAGTAGTNGMGRYVPSKAGINDPEVSEMIEHLGNAIPLTSSELHSEGLGRYVSDTVVRATHASALKMQDAGVAEVLKPSDKDPNTSLIRVADLGQPVVEEQNPSLPHNSYGPTQINYAGNQDVTPSGLFNRGAFYSSLPKN